MVRTLVLIHRWLGVAVCGLFVMWFASGIVMHLVPFPSLTDAERIAGLSSINASGVHHGVRSAVIASGVHDARRVRLIQRVDGPVYVITGSSALVAFRADDLSNAKVTSAELAVKQAISYARNRNMDATGAHSADLAVYDQWTVPNGYDSARPFFKVALHDAAATEVYISAVTGEVVLDTTRQQRIWNYPGSVVHWIYPTVLRSHWVAWDRVVWTLSLIAMLAAITGTALGLLRLQKTDRGIQSPFRGWHAWHHILGLITATFVLTWIFSGWLSMDHGRLFSRGQLSDTEAAILIPAFGADRLPDDRAPDSEDAKEKEWFSFGERIYLRSRSGITTQTVFAPGQANPAATRLETYLTTDAIEAAVARTGTDCTRPIIIAGNDNYFAASPMRGAPVYRSVCGDVWFHIDGASGRIIERLDSSRRSYRWAYNALHTLNFPMFANRPSLRSAIVIGLCLIGLLFSVTGTVLGWRRLRKQF